MTGFTTVILAAGKGTRMKSELPKVLHRAGGKAMLQHVLDAASAAGAARHVVVVGCGAQRVVEEIGAQASFAEQSEQLGTGHAVMQAESLLREFAGTVMVLCGDTPLLTAALLGKLYAQHREVRAAATVLTARMPDATGYGRIIRTSDGRVDRIVEQKDASAEELVVDEVNSGIYCFERQALFAALAETNCENAQGEFYLTDVLEILNRKGQKVWAVQAGDYRETLGVNSRRQLAEAEKILRRRKLEALMDAGVTIMDPDSTFVDADVTVGFDTVLYPFTWLEGGTAIGARCTIGPSSRFSDARVGDDVTAQFVYAHECEIGDGAALGPYVHLRPGAKLAVGVKVGNFVEVKNANVGADSKLPHLSYIGDADIGAGVNMGCGTITVNYDGKQKFRTVVEDGAFVGCNSNLVAPVTVGKAAYVGAGSTITKDVPPGALGVARSRQANLERWRDKRK